MRRKKPIKNLHPISSTNLSCQEFLNFCMKYFNPTSDYLTVIIPDQRRISFYCLTKKDERYQISYICECRNERLDRRIFWNFENHEIIVLFKEGGYDRSILPGVISQRIRFKEFQDFEHPFFNQLYSIKTTKAYQDLGYPLYPLPKFEYHIQDLSNFEAILYLILNESKVFMGEKVAVLVPKGYKIYIYIFRRLLLHFLLESNFITSIKTNIIAETLHSSVKIAVAIFKPFPNLKISETFEEVQSSPKNVGKGQKFYEKAENENALGIYSTENYLKVLDEAENEFLLNSFYFEPAEPLPAAPPRKREKVIIQIKNETIRICVAKKMGNDFDILFSYPESTKFSENDDFIPLYISFLRETRIIGKNAIQDYNTHPEYVIFDIFKIAGKTISNLPKINTKWGFQLVPIKNSLNAKLGFKIQTPDGTKLFPPEIVLSMIFKYLLQRFKEYLTKEEGFLVHFIDKKLTTAQQNILWETGKLLDFPLKMESQINLGNRLIKKQAFQNPKKVWKFEGLTEESL